MIDTLYQCVSPPPASVSGVRFNPHTIFPCTCGPTRLENLRSRFGDGPEGRRQIGSPPARGSLRAPDASASLAAGRGSRPRFGASLPPDRRSRSRPSAGTAFSSTSDSRWIPMGTIALTAERPSARHRAGASLVAIGPARPATTGRPDSWHCDHAKSCTRTSARRSIAIVPMLRIGRSDLGELKSHQRRLASEILTSASTKSERAPRESAIAGAGSRSGRLLTVGRERSAEVA
jgi:hypothetical protein